MTIDEEILSRIECPICKTTPAQSRYFLLPTCSHSMCESCLRTIYDTNNNSFNCPLCNVLYNRRDIMGRGNEIALNEEYIQSSIADVIHSISNKCDNHHHSLRQKDYYCLYCDPHCSSPICIDCYSNNHQGDGHCLIHTSNTTNNSLTKKAINTLKMTEYDNRSIDINTIKSDDEMLELVSTLKQFFTGIVTPITANRCAMELVAREICNTKMLYRVLTEEGNGIIILSLIHI